jgi:hypothetical protein
MTSRARNHSLRFEGILKNNLQESRGAAHQIRQKRIPQNGQSFTPVNGLGILHGRLLLDLQFFRSTFENRHTPSYELDAYRQSVSELKKLSSSQLTGLTRSIEKLNRRFRTVGVIAPALMYEAERPDIADLNRTLFEAAKSAAEAIRRANICFRGTWRKRHGGARCHKYSLEPCDESARAGVLFRLRI